MKHDDVIIYFSTIAFKIILVLILATSAVLKYVSVVSCIMYDSILLHAKIEGIYISSAWLIAIAILSPTWSNMLFASVNNSLIVYDLTVKHIFHHVVLIPLNLCIAVATL